MCGGSLFGKLGLGEGVGAPLPARVLDFGRGRVLAVTCGSKHTCALVLGAASANLSAYAWGSTKGVLGLPAAALPPKTSAAGATAGGGAENAVQAEGQRRVVPFPTRIHPRLRRRSARGSASHTLRSVFVAVRAPALVALLACSRPVGASVALSGVTRSTLHALLFFIYTDVLPVTNMIVI